MPITSIYFPEVAGKPSPVYAGGEVFINLAACPGCGCVSDCDATCYELACGCKYSCLAMAVIRYQKIVTNPPPGDYCHLNCDITVTAPIDTGVSSSSSVTWQATVGGVFGSATVSCVSGVPNWDVEMTGCTPPPDPCFDCGESAEDTTTITTTPAGAGVCAGQTLTIVKYFAFCDTTITEIWSVAIVNNFPC